MDRAQREHGETHQEPDATQPDEKALEQQRRKQERETQQTRQQAQHALDHPETVGEPMVYDNAPNVAGKDQPAGPMTKRFAMGGRIFQRYGKRFEVVGSAEHGVLAVDLEQSEPKTIYYLTAPANDDYEAKPEA